nr:E3 ubiquitin-protein ligase SIRP1-like [Tanacetum cinerariifolium]
MDPIIELESVKFSLCQGEFVEEVDTVRNDHHQTDNGSDFERTSLLAPLLRSMLNIPRLHQSRQGALEQDNNQEDQSDSERGESELSDPQLDLSGMRRGTAAIFNHLLQGNNRATVTYNLEQEFTSKYGISEDVYPKLPGLEDRIVDFLEGKNTPQCYTKPLDSLKNWNNRFFWVDERVFPTTVDWRTHAPKDEMLAANTYSRDMNLFNLISAPNPSEVKTGLRLRAAYEVSLLTATASRVIDMEDPDATTESFGTPSIAEKSPLDFDNENPASLMTEGKSPEDQAQETVEPEILPPGNMPVAGATSEVREEEVAALEPHVSKKCGRMWNDRADANAPPKVLRKDYASVHLDQSTHRRKSLPMMGSYEVPTRNVATMEVQDTNSAENDRVEKRCAEIDARMDALSIDFDEEMYPHMVTAIAGIAKGMSEGLKYGVEHGKANLDLEAIEAYDMEAGTKYVATLYALRNLKYPMVDQLELLKDALIDVVMASLHLESDSREDAPQWIRELHPNTVADAIAADVSRAEKKNKCRVVCRTHEISSAHHDRSDGVPVSVPTIAPQGLAILLADATTRTETCEDGASPRLLRSNSLPVMYNLD